MKRPCVFVDAHSNPTILIDQVHYPLILVTSKEKKNLSFMIVSLNHQENDSTELSIDNDSKLINELILQWQTLIGVQ